MNFDKNTAANKVLPQWGVKCFYETFVLKQTVVHLLNFGAENPPLRQYPNRYAQGFDFIIGNSAEKIIKKM